MPKKKTGDVVKEVPDTSAIKPTAKQLVGGASWTGKLPQALLSEFCQKQKWLKPDYNLSHRQGYTTVSCILSKKNPKNSEVESVALRPTQEELAVLPAKETAVEARNVAATWCLHRVGHTLNFSMQMPPDHRILWQRLELIRKDDVKNNKAFLYALDPFKNVKEHAIEVKQWDKLKEQHVKEKIERNGAPPPWKNVPQLEMSREVRSLIESVIGSLQLATASPANKSDRSRIISQLLELGFQKNHAEEACDHARTLETALEFLLLFTPEDDLPHRFLPPNYSTGLTGSSHDTKGLQRDYASKRLSSAGYNLELCRQNMLCDDETLALQRLQAGLLNLHLSHEDSTSSQTEWHEEVATLKAIYGDAMSVARSEVILKLPTHQSFKLHLLPPVLGVYPNVLPSFYITTTAPLAAYRKLAIISQLGKYAQSFLGQPMSYMLLEYIDEHINQIIDNPGKLLDLAGTVVGRIQPTEVSQKVKSAQRKRRQIIWEPNTPTSVSMKAHRQELEARGAHKKKLNARQTLPAYSKRADILQALKSSQCLIISGETGSGKSTQVVQYILDDMIDTGLGQVCNIICTQPRRISALGLADRVADERSNAKQVGYAIRGDSKQGPETKISFVTTGVLLRRLTVHGDAGLDGVTHVFVDEVHERSIDSDFLLIALREVLKHRPDLKVILMSATVEAELFCNYLQAKHIHISGRTFPVEDIYLEDMHFLHADGQREKSRNGVDFALIADIVKHIDATESDGAILVFLPGTLEISRAIAAINEVGRFHTLPLHASLPSDQQKLVFQRSTRGRKVICATNVAETSITIDDVIAVIDTGRVKQMNYDSQSGMSKFEEVWCSKAACKQRRGRAGRVRAGKCYKTFTRSLESAKMPDNTAPEIIRTPLEQVALSALAMEKNARQFISKAVTVPDQRSLDSALTLLRQVGAIDDEEQLTPLGSLIALIPADLKISKLLILSTIFGQLDRALIVAACLSSKSPFFPGPETSEVRSTFSNRDGDVFADMRAYEEWDALSTRERRSWCAEKSISIPIMQEIKSNIAQYRDALSETGLRVEPATPDDDLLKALIAAALMPNIARIQFPDVKYNSTIGGAVARDHESRTIKFYNKEQRIFLHPSSTLFAENEYKKAHFISYFSGTLSSKIVAGVTTTKYFIRGVTPNGLYGHLLLGSPITLDPAGRGLISDAWLRVNAWPKIAVFVQLMRGVIDSILQRKIDHPQSKLTKEDDDMIFIMKRLISAHGH